MGQRGWYVGEHAFECHIWDGIRAKVIEDHVPVVKGMLQCVAMFRRGLGAWFVSCCWALGMCAVLGRGIAA